MTVSSPGAPRWRHMSQNGSNTEVLITAVGTGIELFVDGGRAQI
jgi:hypothetical protein